MTNQIVVSALILWAIGPLGAPAQTCGPEQNTLGDLITTSLGLSSPDENGFVTAQLNYKTAVGSGESIPSTIVAVKIDGSLDVQMMIQGQGEGGCPDAQGFGNECVQSGCPDETCTGGNCDCMKSPNGSFEKCKCN